MANNDKRWSGRSRGGSFGYGFFIFLMNVFGIRAAYAFLSLVVVYFIPFAPRATRAVWFYNRRILRYGVFRSAVKLYAHYYALGQTIIDRVAIGSGMADRYKFEFENYDAFLRLLDGGRGAVIIGAHVGCWGTGAGFFGDYARKMHLVMYDAEYRRIKNVMDKHCKQEGYKVIPVNEGGFQCVVVLPKGTNTELTFPTEKTGEDSLMTAKNKWLIAHEDAKIEGAFNGLKGENITID